MERRRDLAEVKSKDFARNPEPSSSLKTDTIFYRLFQTFPSIFFELINHSPEEADAYQFSSVEIKQLAFRIDGVFLPTPNALDQPIYFVEVQFQRDPKFYSRFFAEIFLYLDKTELTNDWRGVVVYPTRSIDSGNSVRYRELLTPERVRRIYLNELGSAAEQSLGIQTIKLVIEPEQSAGTRARELIDQARQQIADEVALREIIQLIETILVYKLPSKSREEIQAMFGLSELKQTRVYQEAFQEGIEEGERRGKLEAVPRLLALGLSVEQVAEALGLEIEAVRQAEASEVQNNEPTEEV